MVRLVVCSWIAGLALAGSIAAGRTDTTVESSRPVSSDDGKKTVVVDRLTPVVDGVPEKNSGRMLLRVTSSDSSPKQRYIEASQVRVIQPPVWLDGSRVCAFVYNVAKNSNGIVYFEPETNRALQVEFVMPARHMAASGKVEQELTSLEVTDFAKDTMKIRNVPWQGGSAFPLVLPPLPDFQGRPYDAAFLQQLNGAIGSYRQWLGTNKLTTLEPEQASESFSADNKWLGLLACAGDDSYVLAVPLDKGTKPEAVFGAVKLGKLSGVKLSCSQHATSEAEDQPMADERYLTSWEGPAKLQVLKEVYDTETEAARTVPVATLDVTTGKLATIASPTTDTPTTAPAASEE